MTNNKGKNKQSCVFSMALSTDVVEALTEKCEELNVGKPSYMPPLSRNAMVKAMLLYGIEHMDEIFKEF
mgnify:CR=1 FL=1